MGKRELLIALGFVVVGIAAYQLTAPPPKDGERGFSLWQLWDRMRAEIREDATRASVQQADAIKLAPEVNEVRIVEAPRGFKVVGEPRRDIGYELTVESTGPTEEAAKQYAQATRVQVDEFGSSVVLRMVYPKEGRQSAQLILRVPAQLTVRVQSSRNVEVAQVASLVLEGVSGDCKAIDVKGSVTGAHSSGEIEISRAGSVKLTLQNSEARFNQIAGGVTTDARGGELHLTDTRGAADLTATNQEIVIQGHDGAVRIGGSGGRVELIRPTAESRIDMRRSEIEVTLDAPLSLMLATTDEPLTLLLTDRAAITLDAVATESRIDATAVALTPESGERDARLTHTFGSAASNARVSIRNLRGDIVIGKTK